MKKIVIILITYCLGFLTNSFGQNDDSTIINKVNDNYIEIQSLRHELFKWTVVENGAIKESFVPQTIPLKNGVVFIKDRLNRPIAIYVYSDSNIVQNDHFYEGRLNWQSINFSDSTGIDKYYWENGNLKTLIYVKNNHKKAYNYTKEGELIDLKEDYTELVRRADNYFFDKNYTKAIEFYSLALGIRPDEEYPSVQLKKLDKLK